MDSIASCSTTLIDPSVNPASRLAACESLYRLFTSTTTVPTHTPSTTLPAGIALSPNLAAQCLLDSERTAILVRGVVLAVEEAARRFPLTPIEIVYAGTGPFAPLVLLALPHLRHHRLRITLLDIDPASIASVRALLHHFHPDAPIDAILCADATTYAHPRSIHVVISETLQRSLSREPLAAILRNLRPQLAPRGQVVPECVAIELALVDADLQQARWRGEAVDVSATPIATLFAIDALGETPGAGDDTVITLRPTPDRAQWLALYTHITAFGHEIIPPYASGLTVPEILWPLSPVMEETTIAFHYATGPEPGIRWRSICTPSPA